MKNIRLREYNVGTQRAVSLQMSCDAEFYLCDQSLCTLWLITYYLSLKCINKGVKQ